LTIGFIAIVAVMLAESAVLATTFVRSGPVKSVKVASSNSPFSTLSTALVDVPGMSLTVAVPSGEKGTFLVTLSAPGQCYGDSSVACLVQVLIDGNVMVPGEVAWSYGHPDPTTNESHSMQWLAGPLSSGNHTIKVRIHVGGDGEFVVTGSTLSVLRIKS